MTQDKKIEEIRELNLLLEDITVDNVLFNSDGEAIDVITVHAVDGAVTNTLANVLYNAGYRMQNETASEIFDVIDNFLLQSLAVIDKEIDKNIREGEHGIATICSHERSLVMTIKVAIAEIRKNYTKGGAPNGHNT